MTNPAPSSRERPQSRNDLVDHVVWLSVLCTTIFLLSSILQSGCASPRARVTPSTSAVTTSTTAPSSRTQLRLLVVPPGGTATLTNPTQPE